MSDIDTATAAEPQDQPPDPEADPEGQSQGQGDSEDNYFLQVFLTRGQPDDPANPQPPDDAMEVAADAWQFSAPGDDAATMLAMDTLAGEYGGDRSAQGQALPPRPGQQPQQGVQGPGPGQGAGQQVPGQVPGQGPVPQGQGQAGQGPQPAMSQSPGRGMPQDIGPEDTPAPGPGPEDDAPGD